MFPIRKASIALEILQGRLSRLSVCRTDSGIWMIAPAALSQGKLSRLSVCRMACKHVVKVLRGELTRETIAPERLSQRAACPNRAAYTSLQYRLSRLSVCRKQELFGHDILRDHLQCRLSRLSVCRRRSPFYEDQSPIATGVTIASERLSHQYQSVLIVHRLWTYSDDYRA